MVTAPSAAIVNLRIVFAPYGRSPPAPASLGNGVAQRRRNASACGGLSHRRSRPEAKLRRVTDADPDQLRALTRETWETAAAGWGREGLSGRSGEDR